MFCALKVLWVSALLLCALLSGCVGTLFFWFFCMPVTFSPFSFLDIRETKMLPRVRFETHWSIYKILSVGFSLTSGSVPLFCSTTARERQSERKQKRLMPGKATKPFGSQNKLTNKMSHLRWAIYIYISSYILYGTPMCRIQQNGKFVWEHLSNTSVSKILKTLTQTVVNEFTLSRKCSHSSSSVPTLLLLHYTCLYLQLQYDYFMKQWNTLYQAFMTINAALDQNSPFSGWLNIYRLRLPVSEHGRSSPLLAHNWRCFPQQPSAWASVDSHLISLALWDLISVGVYHALSHKNKKMWKNFHLIYRG